MSDNIPFEMQVEIMKRLPVKPLLQFRSVSKQWKLVIDSSEFIIAHGLNQNQSHILLLDFGIDFEDKFLSIVDDDTLSHNKMISPTIKIPITSASMVGCSGGLVCLTAFDLQSRNDLVFIWNPSIRKCVAIAITSEPYSYELGFGVCSKTGDPKLVRLTRPVSETDDWMAEVFTLSSGAWRRVPLKMRWPNKEMHFSHYQVVIDTVIHWIVHYTVTNSYHVIVSFDMTTEEFEEADVSFAKTKFVSISKLKGSLVVLDYNKEALVSEVWMMIKNGGSKSSFTKLFIVSFKPTPETLFYEIIGFKKNGELMVEHSRQYGGETTLEVYDTNSKQLNEIEVDISYLSMVSYTESLLLLNHSDSIIQS